MLPGVAKAEAGGIGICPGLPSRNKVCRIEARLARPGLCSPGGSHTPHLNFIPCDMEMGIRVFLNSSRFQSKFTLARDKRGVAVSYFQNKRRP